MPLKAWEEGVKEDGRRGDGTQSAHDRLLRLILYGAWFCLPLLAILGLLRTATLFFFLLFSFYKCVFVN